MAVMVRLDDGFAVCNKTQLSTICWYFRQNPLALTRAALVVLLLEAGRWVLGLPLPGLDPVLPHCQWPVNPVELVVEAARVADGLALVVPAPQRGRRRAAVGAAEADPPRGRLEHGTLKRKHILVGKWMEILFSCSVLVFHFSDKFSRRLSQIILK